MKKYLALLLLGWSVVPVHAENWGKSRLWDDGRAEVAVYESERVVDNKPRSFREQLITMQEDLRQDTLVKADNPKAQKTFRVFKFNDVQKFDTENYPYSYLTSVFVLEDPVQRVVKISAGSQEWGGNTFKLYKGEADGSAGTLSINSYFDKEADQTFKLDIQKNDYFEDQLPLSLRALPFKASTETPIRVWDSLPDNHGLEPHVSSATLRVEEEEVIHCHAGSPTCWRVTLKRPSGTDTYWFEKADPHILVKMETADGRKRLLYGRARWSYWDRRLPQPNILN